MSTVMYCHKICKSGLWQFCDELRRFYREKSIAFRLLQSDEEIAILMKEVVFNKEFYVSLQLFERNNSFIFRVLSNDYLFLNNWIFSNNFSDIEPIFYDNRSDIPPEHEVNKEIAKWVDDRINNWQYFIVPIIDQEYLSNALFEIRRSKINER